MNKIVIKLSKVFGIYLPFKTPTYNYYYGVFMCLIYILYSSVMIHNDVNNSSESLTSVIQSFMLMLVNWLLIIRTTFSSNELIQIETTLEDIANLHTKIIDIRNSATIEKHSYILFTGTHIAYVLFMISSYYIWGHEVILKFVMQVLPEYIYLTVFLLQWEILNTLHGSIKCLNHNVSQCFLDNHNFLESAKKISVEGNFDDVHMKLNTILLLVEKHNDIVFNYNEHFGWNILFSTLIAVHYLLGFVSELFTSQSVHDNNEMFGYIAQVYNIVSKLPIRLFYGN